jgi:hypothetical protein
LSKKNFIALKVESIENPSKQTPKGKTSIFCKKKEKKIPTQFAFGDKKVRLKFCTLLPALIHHLTSKKTIEWKTGINLIKLNFSFFVWIAFCSLVGSAFVCKVSSAKNFGDSKSSQGIKANTDSRKITFSKTHTHIPVTLSYTHTYTQTLTYTHINRHSHVHHYSVIVAKMQF